MGMGGGVMNFNGGMPNAMNAANNGMANPMLMNAMMQQQTTEFPEDHILLVNTLTGSCSV
jgi:hypothetical protein